MQKRRDSRQRGGALTQAPAGPLDFGDFRLLKSRGRVKKKEKKEHSI